MSEKKKVVIFGAGVGGLADGYFLGRTEQYDITVIEKESVIGGLCGSFVYNGFVLDYGPHKIYSVLPGILDEIRDLMGDRLLRLPKKHRLFLRKNLVYYPIADGESCKSTWHVCLSKTWSRLCNSAFTGPSTKTSPTIL